MARVRREMVADDGENLCARAENAGRSRGIYSPTQLVQNKPAAQPETRLRQSPSETDAADDSSPCVRCDCKGAL